MPKKIIDLLAIALTLPLMLVILSPLSFYINNISEINFSLRDILVPVSGVFVSTVALFYVILSISKFSEITLKVTSSIVLSMAFMVWVQSQILTWNFGPLDGRGVQWETWRIHSLFEIGLWITVLCVSLLCIIKGFINIKSTAIYLNLLFVISMTSIILPKMDTFITSLKEAEDVSENYTPLTFDSNNNIIVFVFDSFQSDYFDYIRLNYPSEISFLKDFTFYKDTISSYPTTAPNLPSIFSSTLYKNEIPFDEYLEDAYEYFDLKGSMEQAGYATEIVGSPNNLIPGATSREKLLISYEVGGTFFWQNFIDFGLFKAFPTIFKPKVYDEGNWLASSFFIKNYPPGVHGQDLKVMEAFVENATREHVNEKGKFSYFHFFTTHMPLVIDENLEYNENLTGSDGYVRQARGAIEIIRNLIETLKEIDVYDNSEIFIIADHGTLQIPPISRLNEPNSKFMNIQEAVHSSALSLFLHKPKNSSSSDLTISKKQLYLSDLPCFLEVSLQIDCDDFVTTNQNGSDRMRKYYFYDWNHTYWRAEYLPPMTEYFILGDSYNVNSWSFGDNYYASGKIEALNIPKISLNEEVHTDNSSSKNLDFILKSGWSRPEPRHVWSDSKETYMSIALQQSETINNNIGFFVNISPFLFDELTSQEVSVEINNTNLGRWEVTQAGWYFISVPSSIVPNNIIDAKFLISNPTKPCDISDSSDCRAVGIALRSIAIVDSFPSNYTGAFFFGEQSPLTEQKSIGLQTPINFQLGGNSAPYLVSGWSRAEANFRWSTSTNPRLRIPIHQPHPNSINIELMAYLGNNAIDEQEVDILINGELIRTLSATAMNKFTIPLPEHLLFNETLEIEFQISNPIRPCDVTDSSDCRNLGIALKSLTLTNRLTHEK